MRRFGDTDIRSCELQTREDYKQALSPWNEEVKNLVHFLYSYQSIYTRITDSHCVYHLAGKAKESYEYILLFDY